MRGFQCERVSRSRAEGLRRHRIRRPAVQYDI